MHRRVSDAIMPLPNSKRRKCTAEVFVIVAAFEVFIGHRVHRSWPLTRSQQRCSMPRSSPAAARARPDQGTRSAASP
jgi:hypothetical protein